MSDWPRVQISEVCELIVDCVNKTAPRVDYETPYKMIRTPNVKNGRVDLSDCRFVEKETYEKWTRRAKVLRDDVLLTREAPMGEVGLVDFDDTVFLGQRIMQYRADPAKLDSDFLLYAFLSPDLQHQFRMHDGSGSVVSHIRVPDCSKFEINLPPLNEQKRIAKILRDLDRKIQLNRQTNQTLEQIAQAIFKSWFVDFEPTRAKIQAKKRWQALNDTTETSSPTCYSEELDTPNPTQQQQPNLTLDQAMTQAAMAAISDKSIEAVAQLSPEQQQQLKTIADLFPDALVESELGEIPEGWEVKPFGKLLSKTIGGDWGKEEPDDKHTERVKILRGTDLPKVYSGMDEKVPTRYVDPKKLSSRKLQPGDIVIEVSGGSKDQPTGRSLFLTQEIMDRLNADLEPASFCRLFRSTDIECGLMLGLHLRKIYDDGKTWQYQNQSTGISNFQTKVFLENELVVVPPGDVKQRFYETTMPLIQKMSSAENQDLTKVRDAILPKLLSGELSLATELEVLETTE